MGHYSSGISYSLCDGLFCTGHHFSNYTPVWSYGFLNHNNTESSTVQYICSNWKDIREKIIAGISEKIAKDNERKIQVATKNLENGVENFISSSEELEHHSEWSDNISNQISPVRKRGGR